MTVKEEHTHTHPPPALLSVPLCAQLCPGASAAVIEAGENTGGAHTLGVIEEAAEGGCSTKRWEARAHGRD